MAALWPRMTLAGSAEAVHARLKQCGTVSKQPCAMERHFLLDMIDRLWKMGGEIGDVARGCPSRPFMLRVEPNVQGS